MHTGLDRLRSLPRHDRYLMLLPPDLLTVPELVTRLRQLRTWLVELDRYEAHLLDEIERRRAES
jgi:hypothetical protein